MRRDKRGLSGAEWFFVLFIALLLVITVVFAVLIGRIGPEKEPHLVIQDVYYMENEDGLTAYVYISNLGEPSGTGTLEWTLTRSGDRLVEQGEQEFTIEGRKTDTAIFEFSFDGDEEHRLEIDIFHGNEKVDYYSKRLSP